MAGNKDGAKRAVETNKQKYGKDYYSKIGSRSWSNPDRSRETGFALNRDLAREAGKKGGSKTKKEYKDYITEEDFIKLTKENDPGIS